jgi:WD40 repeat protein
VKKIAIGAVILGWGLVFTVYCAADVVTRPLRTYGLGDLLQAAISPDGRWVATSGSSGGFVWDFSSGTLRHRLEGNRGQVIVLCFSPDSRILLTAGYDAVVDAWDVESGMKLRSFEGHQGAVLGLAFSPGGQTFVSVADTAARVWSLGTGQLLHNIQVPGAFILRAMFTPDGNRLVTVDGSFDGSTNHIQLWDLATEQIIRRFGDQVNALAFVDGSRLVTGQGTAVQVWDIETGQVIRSLLGATFLVQDLAASTNSSRVIAGCVDGRVITWDASTGVVLNNFLGESLVAMHAIPGTNHVLTASGGDNLVRVKDIATGATLRTIEGHTTSTILGVGFSPDGRYVLSGGHEPLTRLWNRTNAQPVRMFPGHGAGTVAASFSPDGTRILTTFGSPRFVSRLWNTETGLLEREFTGHTSWLMAAAFSPDGQRITTGAQDGTARLWDVATGGELRTFTNPGTWIHSVALSSNGTFFAGGSSDGIARLWNTTKGELLRSFEMNAGAVVALAFSPATGDLYVAWADGVLRLFNPVTGAVKLDSIAPSGFPGAASFSPDGRFILGAEGFPSFTARLWDARTGEVLRDFFAGHNAPVTSVAFNKSGTSILTGSDVVRLWSIADIAARLESEHRPNSLELRWSAGTLQHSTRVNGPWVDVTDASSPWSIATDQPSRFYRVQALADE